MEGFICSFGLLALVLALFGVWSLNLACAVRRENLGFNGREFRVVRREFAWGVGLDLNLV